MNKLTFAQQIIFDCIKKYYKENAEMPTVKELCSMSGLKSKSTVHFHLMNLQEKGYIEVEYCVKKGIKILKDN